MAESPIVIPPDYSGGKSTRARSGDPGMPASTWTPATFETDIYGYSPAEFTGNLTALNVAVTGDAGLANSSWVVDVRGTFVGTVSFEFSANGADWGGAVARLTGVGGNTDLVTSTTVPGLFRGNSSGMRYVRARMSAYTSGTATVVLRMASGTGPVFLNAALPPGYDTIGGTTPGTASGSTIARVTSVATNATLQAANTARRGLLVFNESTAVLYVKYGATASVTSYTVRIGAGGYWEMPNPVYTGIVDGIWASANGAAMVTELVNAAA